MAKTGGLQFDWLRALVAIIDSGSLSAAALQVHRSQGAVSVQLAKLEQATGQKLVHRGPRRSAPTAAGLQLLGYARQILALHTEICAAMGAGQLTGRVRVGVPDDYAAPYFTPALQAFARTHSAVHVELSCEQSSALIPKVQSGEIDLAIVSRHRPHYGTPLFEEPLVWVGSSRHTAWRRNPLSVALYEAASFAHKEAVRALQANGIAHRIAYNSASLAGQITAVDSGLAVAVLTRCSVPTHLLVLGPKQGLPALKNVNVVAVRSKASAGNPVVDAMYDTVVQTLRRI
jgi:DNA-binding transcriptional LysR family regulator